MPEENKLEPEFADAYNTWKKDQTPAGHSAILKTLTPVIDKAISHHVGATQSNPLLVSRARRMTLASLPDYDATKAKLQTHIFNQLQGLKRVHRQQSQILGVPERVSLDRQRLDASLQELRDLHGREPSDSELADHSGMSYKRIERVRTYNPAIAEGTLEAKPGGIMGGVKSQQGHRSLWHEVIYAELPPLDQKVMEHTLGLHGQRPLSNQDLARHLRVSPGYISQRKLAIQKLLDKEQELSPFEVM